MNDKPSLNGQAASGGGHQTVKVWDFPTRIFHWALVFMVLVVWISSEADGNAFMIHIYSGTLLIGFVAFRTIWGVIGSRYARFGDFVHGLDVVKDYTKRFIAFRPPHSTGHNPLGGWMVIALLVVLLLSVLTGLMSSEDGYVGPLAHIAGGIFGETHEGFANVLLFLIIGHIVGVFVHGFITRENLPRAMITGNKEIDADVKAESIRSTGIIRPTFAVALAGAVVYYFIR